MASRRTEVLPRSSWLLTTPVLLAAFLLAALLALGAAGGGDAANRTARAGRPEAAAGRTRVVVGGLASYPPYEFVHEGSPTGFITDTTRAIARATDLDVEFRMASRAATRQALQSGTVDVMQGMFHTREYEKSLDFSAPITTVQFAVFSCRKNGRYDSLEELRGHRVVVVRGSPMEEQLRENGVSGRLLVVENVPQAIRFLLSRQGDCFVTSRAVGMHYVQRMDLDGTVVAGMTVMTLDCCYAVRKGNSPVLAPFDRGLAAIKTDGEYDEIRRKWLEQFEPQGPSARTVLTYAAWVLVPLLALLTIALLWSRSLRRLVTIRTAELREQSRKLDASFEHSLTPTVFLDPKFDFIRVNEAYAQACGRPATDFAGRNHFELCPHEENRAIFEGVVRTRQPHRAWAQPFTFPDRPERGVTYWNWTLAPILDAAGRVEFLVLSLEDVTAQVLDREKIRKAEEESRFRSMMLDMASDSIFVHDTGGRMIYVNQAACEARGYAREELLAMTIMELDAPDSAALVKPRIEELQRTGHMVFESAHRRKDGSIMPVEVHARIVEVEGRRLVMSVVHDLTEHKRADAERDLLQAQLLQAQKMDAVGRLAGGVAHDFNNMMTVVTGYGNRLLRDPGLTGFRRAAVEQMVRAGERSAALTRQLLAFGRKQVLQPVRLDLNDVVAEMREMLPSVLGEDVLLEVALEKEPWPILADHTQVSQVIMNLATNARDAMPQGGRLTLRTANVEHGEQRRRRHPEVLPGRYVRLEVSDTGTGMTPEVREHLFEPFFTTKEPWAGTGLGLSTVYGIVSQSGGHIEVDTEPGKGSSFKVCFPALAEEKTGQEPASASPAQAGDAARGSESVLVVEDEPEVCDLVAAELRDLGYEVLACKNVGDALQAAESSPAPIDLLLTDVVMPAVSGRRLADMLTSRGQVRRVLYMSGHTEKYIVSHGVLEAGVDFISKPFTLEDLADKVRSILDRPGEG